MARSPEYLQGFREASKLAVRFAHAEADEMNDPHAKQVLDNFAFHVGNALKRAYKDRSGDAPEDGATP